MTLVFIRFRFVFFWNESARVNWSDVACHYSFRFVLFWNESELFSEAKPPFVIKRMLRSSDVKVPEASKTPAAKREGAAEW